MPVPGLLIRQFCRVAFILSVVLLGTARGDEGDLKHKWFLLPKDDLASTEAFEYAILSINEMRISCYGFHLAPLMSQNYELAEVYRQTFDGYSVYRFMLNPKNGWAPTPIKVQLSRSHSISDLSLFQVLKVDPGPCDLFSALDDAELLVPWKTEGALEAQKAALTVFNTQRSSVCPERPQLQLERVVAASEQVSEGKVTRLVLEMREATTSFDTDSFTDTVIVSYALDQAVPGQCTLTPEIYSSRMPCAMRYTAEEQNANSDHTQGAGKRQQGDRRLLDSRRVDIASAPRRRLGSILDSAPSGAQVARRFLDKGISLPDNFDPRLKRTLCFPRGFSRRQGGCGASWAFAATAVASLRECIFKLNKGDVGRGLTFLSAQELVSCDGQGDGCAGGSAASAFYYMKDRGIATESCSPYRLRCFNDDSGIAHLAADYATSQYRSTRADDSSGICPHELDRHTSPCRCLPGVYHFPRALQCEQLPNACPKVKVPHYFYITGTAEGNEIELMERHMMQELITAGPLYISLVIFDDFYDPVSWTESGIYIHKRGDLIGRHAVAAVGWGTDSNGRDYWLLLNSFGDGWQDEGYFKILRGETSLKMSSFGAWGVDWSKPEDDTSDPTIADVELSFSPVVEYVGAAASEAKLTHAFLVVFAYTDEPARMLVRVEGLSSTVTLEGKDTEFVEKHVLKLDLLSRGLLDDRAKVQIWAVDRAENTASWGPYSFVIADQRTFQRWESRRLVAVSLNSTPGGGARSRSRSAKSPFWV